MSFYLGKVVVTPKPAVNDPQGVTITGGLHALGFRSVQQVRMGKYLEVQLEAADQTEAQTKLEEMCRKLLSNTVIEDFRFDLEEVAAHAAP